MSNRTMSIAEAIDRIAELAIESEDIKIIETSRVTKKFNSKYWSLNSIISSQSQVNTLSDAKCLISNKLTESVKVTVYTLYQLITHVFLTSYTCWNLTLLVSRKQKTQ